MRIPRVSVTLFAGRLQLREAVRAAAAVVLLSTVSQSQVPTPDSTALRFYRSLVHAINATQGTMLLDLAPGEWKGAVSGAPVYWNNDVGTVMAVTFNYSTGCPSCSRMFSGLMSRWSTPCRCA